MTELAALITEFVQAITKDGIEIYNEFSLQHELGIFLRNKLPEYLVQFERNVESFKSLKSNFTKREIDIVVYTKDRKNLKYAIELKYPRNGQYPEQMFSFCKDIAFAEELKALGFTHTALLIFAEDPLFYRGTGNDIYGYFRSGNPITGLINKPTGAKDEHITIKGSYVATWLPLSEQLRYALIEI